MIEGLAGGRSKRFNKKAYDASLNPHKNSKTGYQCYGTYGVYETTKY